MRYPYEMIAAEVKGRDPKNTWEIVELQTRTCGC